MRLVRGFSDILIYLLLCLRVQRFSAMTPLHLPIFEMIYQKSNQFNESIIDTNTFFKEYDFIVIGMILLKISY